MNISKGQNLQEFLREEVCIPVFQRDYAQGRDTAQAKEIRQHFIEALYKATSPDGQSLSLDLVFTDVAGLVDGQQRLTTLFLFYLYHGAEECEFANFRYAGRKDVEVFCKELIARWSQGDIKRNIGEGTVSDYVKTQMWFHLAWKDDPTIMGMLRTLDEIHVQAQAKAIDLSADPDWKNRITFIVCDETEINGEKRNAVLRYAAMNARGKTLTDFENLKAYLEGKEQSPRKEQSNWDAWKREIDTTWLNNLWSFYSTDKKDASTECDKALLRITLSFLQIFHAYMLSRRVDNKENLTDGNEEEGGSACISRLHSVADGDEYLSYNDIDVILVDEWREKLSMWTRTLLSNIYESRDWLTPDWEKRTPNWEKVAWTPFRKVTYPELVLLYACVRGKETRQDEQWRAIVHNVVENTTSIDANSLPKAIRWIDALIEDREETLNKSDFSKRQGKEEFVKLSLINSTGEQGAKWETAIRVAEVLPWQKGRIAFLLLQCDEAKKSTIFELNTKIEDYNYEKFENVRCRYTRDFEAKANRQSWLADVVFHRVDEHFIQRKEQDRVWIPCCITDPNSKDDNVRLKRFLYADDSIELAWQVEAVVDEELKVFGPSVWAKLLDIACKNWENPEVIDNPKHAPSYCIRTYRPVYGPPIYFYTRANFYEGTAYRIDQAVVWCYETYDKLRDVARIYKWVHDDGESWIELCLGDVADCGSGGLIVRLCGATRQVQVGVDSIDKGVRKLLSDKGIMTNNLKDDECWAPFDEDCREWQDDELDELVEVLKRSMVEEILRGLRKSPESGGVPGQE